MKEIPTGVFAAIIVVVLAVLLFVGWRASTPATYQGPPIDMGKAMRGNAPAGNPQGR
jgi:hypothetical protein